MTPPFFLHLIHFRQRHNSTVTITTAKGRKGESGEEKKGRVGQKKGQLEITGSTKVTCKNHSPNRKHGISFLCITIYISLTYFSLYLNLLVFISPTK